MHILILNTFSNDLLSSVAITWIFEGIFVGQFLKMFPVEFIDNCYWSAICLASGVISTIFTFFECFLRYRGVRFRVVTFAVPYRSI